MRMPNTNRGRGHWPLPRLAVLGAALLLPLAACDTERILEVEDPVFASPSSLENASGVPTLIAGAVGDFQIAYSGAGDDSFLTVTSLITDELFSSGTFITRTVTDQRQQQPTAQGNTSDPAFTRLQRARRSLRDAGAAVESFRTDPLVSPTATARITELKALEGFTYVALAEGFCSGIPFSETERGAPRETGQPLSTEQVFNEAMQRFDAALAASAGSNLAKVGRARALLNNGDFQAAAAAVADVPTSFVYFIEHSPNSGRQYNPIFSLQANGRYSVSDREGGNGLPFRSAMDPRVPWIEDPAGGFDKAYRLFINLRYPSFSANVPLADGIEARLIEAEAALRAGDVGTWLTRLNDLRANVRSLMTARYEDYATFVPGPNNPTSTLAPLTDPGTGPAREDLMFQERAFWLFNTGHRLGDMRRMIRQYGRPAESVFPSGEYFKGGNYGPDVNFPIPFDEANNRNWRPEMCNTTQA